MTTTRGVRVSSPTEERNPRTLDIDQLDVGELLHRMNDEDRLVATAVSAAIPELAVLVSESVARVRDGGRVHYFGAGSSGRLGILDAAEIPPTFGVDSLVVAHLAGGLAAVSEAQEGSEDDVTHGSTDAAEVRAGDVAIGLAASGYTPYVGAALERARQAGAWTALITSNPDATLARYADVVVCTDTGPEVITGSTRMKAATAQKLVLNSFSTALMVKLGRTWSNLMVDLVPTNAKLRGRVVRMLEQATGADPASCEAALRDSGNDTKVALIVLRLGVEPTRARIALEQSEGSVAAAITRVSSAARG